MDTTWEHFWNLETIRKEWLLTKNAHWTWDLILSTCDFIVDLKHRSRLSFNEAGCKQQLNPYKTRMKILLGGLVTPTVYTSSPIIIFFSFQSGLFVDSRFGWPNNFEKFFAVISSLKKKEKFPLSLNLYFQQKQPQSCQFETLCLSFWCHKQSKWLFQISKLSWDSYVSL